jgi:hypothetical protein
MLMAHASIAASPPPHSNASGIGNLAKADDEDKLAGGPDDGGGGYELVNEPGAPGDGKFRDRGVLEDELEVDSREPGGNSRAGGSLELELGGALDEELDNKPGGIGSRLHDGPDIGGRLRGGVASHADALDDDAPDGGNHGLDDREPRKGELDCISDGEGDRDRGGRAARKDELDGSLDGEGDRDLDGRAAW